MKIIKCLAEMIHEELEDAEKYGKKALEYKDSDKRLADMFYNLSKQDLEHANMEHEQAVRLIKDQNTEAPAAMQAVWDWEHEHMIDHSAKIRQLQAMYNG